MTLDLKKREAQWRKRNLPFGNAYRMGVEAARAGKDKSACPHEFNRYPSLSGGRLWEAWMEGYLDQKASRKGRGAGMVVLKVHKVTGGYCMARRCEHRAAFHITCVPINPTVNSPGITNLVRCYLHGKAYMRRAGWHGVDRL